MLQDFLNSSQHAAFLKSYIILKRLFFLYEVWIRDCSRILTSFISWFCVCMWEREREVSFLVTFLRTKENFLVVHTARLLVGLTQKVTEHDLALSQCHRTDPETPDPLAAALTTELVGAWFLGLLSRNSVNPVSPPRLWHIVIPTNSRYQTRSESSFFVCTILSSESFYKTFPGPSPSLFFPS